MSGRLLWGSVSRAGTEPKTASIRSDASHETVMKEIDLLPEWYRTGQKRQVNYRTQCIVLSGVFVVMAVWSLATTRSISSVRADLTQMAERRDQAEGASAELAEVGSELKELQQKIGFIEEIDSRIDVASVLAEISSLIDEMVVLSKVEFISEKAGQGGGKPSPGAGAVVRAVQAQFGKKSDLPLGDVRFRIAIAGVAAEASDVMALIRRLEESPYFRRVVLSFSRNAEVGRERAASLSDRTDIIGQRAETEGRTGRSIEVSEFQINCYLGNYREL